MRARIWIARNFRIFLAECVIDKNKIAPGAIGQLLVAPAAGGKSGPYELTGVVYLKRNMLTAYGQGRSSAFGGMRVGGYLVIECQKVLPSGRVHFGLVPITAVVVAPLRAKHKSPQVLGTAHHQTMCGAGAHAIELAYGQAAPGFVLPAVLSIGQGAKHRHPAIVCGI
jgi:hypothetical protein